jgi:hypothetical protein
MTFPLLPSAEDNPGHDRLFAGIRRSAAIA